MNGHRPELPPQTFLSAVKSHPVAYDNGKHQAPIDMLLQNEIELQLVDLWTFPTFQDDCITEDLQELIPVPP